MWVTKLLITPEKKEFLPKNNQIWPKFGIFGQFGPGHAGLFSALLVGRLVVVARAVSRKTPIYFIILFQYMKYFVSNVMACITSRTFLTGIVILPVKSLVFSASLGIMSFA